MLENLKRRQIEKRASSAALPERPPPMGMHPAPGLVSGPVDSPVLSGLGRHYHGGGGGSGSGVGGGLHGASRFDRESPLSSGSGAGGGGGGGLDLRDSPRGLEGASSGPSGVALRPPSLLGGGPSGLRTMSDSASMVSAVAWGGGEGRIEKAPGLGEMRTGKGGGGGYAAALTAGRRAEWAADDV